MLNYITNLIHKVLYSIRNFFYSLDLIKRLLPSRLFRKKPGKASHQAQALQEELDEAKKALRKNLAPDSYTDDYVYLLPWYMIIGQDNSGKTSFIKNSGFDFSPLGKHSARDTSATGICDWWIGNQAVFLDITGQFAAANMQELWNDIVNFLKKERKKKPIDGLIITLDISQLNSMSNDEITTYANHMRSTIINELIIALKFSFPVYLVLTHSDKIEGFDEYFTDLDSDGRSQVWGFTLNKKTADKTYEDIFNTEFDRLFTRLLNRRLFAFTSRTPSPAMCRAFEFPTNLTGVKSKLAAFIRLLFQSSPSREVPDPNFRGCYFIAGVLETQLPAPPQSYFVKNLLKDIVFPDKDLVQPKVTFWTPLNVFSIVTAVVLFIFITVSFINNRGFVEGVYESSNAVYKKSPDDNFEKLENLRGYVERLDKYKEEGVPFLYGMYLYRGEKVTPHAREVYFKRFDDKICKPVELEMEKTLKGRLDDIQEKAKKEETSKGELGAEEDYLLYKAYKMLASDDKKRAPDKPWDADFLFPVMKDHFYENWLEKTGRHLNENQKTNTEKQITFYLSQYNKPKVLYMDKDTQLVANVQTFLKELSGERELFMKIRVDGQKRFRPVNLLRVMDGYSGKNTALTGDYTFSGIYTEEGWNTYVKEAIQKHGQTDYVEDLGMDQESVIKKLDSLYFNSFVDHWRELLKTTRIKEFKNINDALTALNELSGNDPSVAYLFNRFTSMTGTIDKAGDTENSTLADDEFKSIYNIFGGEENTKSPEFESYIESLKQLHYKVKGLSEEELETSIVTIKGQTKLQLSAHDKTYFDAVDDATETALNAISKENGDTSQPQNESNKKNREAVHAILELPLKHTWKLFLLTTQQELEKQWNSVICEYVNKHFHGKVPFALDGKEEVTLDDLIKFFQPDSGMFSEFYVKEIEQFFTYQDGKLTPKTWIDMGLELPEDIKVNILRAKAISENLFAKNKQTPLLNFELCPIPNITLKKIMLIINETEADYRNQPVWWYPVSWSKSENRELASLEVTEKGKKEPVKLLEFKGPMAFFQLMVKARITNLNEQDMKSDCEGLNEKDKKISWEVKPYNIHYYMRTEGDIDLISIAKNLSEFECVYKKPEENKEKESEKEPAKESENKSDKDTKSDSKKDSTEVE